jgi:hypothetical protein
MHRESKSCTLFSTEWTSCLYFLIRGADCLCSVPYTPLLRIRDAYPGSELFPSRIPNFFHPGFRIRIKACLPVKLFQSSGKYDRGCSSRIPDPQHWYTHYWLWCTLSHIPTYYTPISASPPPPSSFHQLTCAHAQKSPEPIIGRHLYTAHVKVSTELFFF